ncbi:MAG TPA: chromosome segregation protein SMC [Symbiobacteriaceae bacterium]|nr:chromosome segregation protein SMC [Symbiobacteriaceae bacterium]
MYLKRLEIIGFKSFAEKTELDFGPGITAVVGPNGSGKSNVADAIRWVLGEQSAKALRGGAMVDVIFAGSSAKRAMGYAQVSLILDNSDGKLGVGFTEVQVTRRVDRSGEGEYFLNGVACRLKDIHDLFLDTGVGRENYSIIGQGKIDEILSTKAEERRAVFEEAAGISRYKLRKREAQRRLEETENALVRITDITGEIESNLGALGEAAEKATQFKVLDEEATGLDQGLIAYAHEAATAKTETIVAETDSLATRLADTEARLESGETRLETAKNLVVALETELTEVGQQLTEATGRHERAEGRLALAQQEEGAAGAEGARLDQEVQVLAQKQAALKAEEAGLEDQVAVLFAELARIQADQLAHEGSLGDLQAEISGTNRQIEQRKDRIVSILQLEAEKKNGLLGAERRREEAQKREDRLVAERTRTESEAKKTRGYLTAMEEDLVALGEEREELRKAIAEAREGESRTQEARQDCIKRGNDMRGKFQATSARLEAIQEMMNAFEGYQKGPRTVLVGREHGAPWASEVLGSVAEVIRTESAYEKALEVALGGSIQNILVATDGGAKAAIEHLKRSAGGRATFMPLNTMRPNPFRADEEREFTGAPGILGSALSLVRFEERFRPAVAFLLGRVLVAQDMDAALAFGKKTGMRYRIVTLDGELLSAGGALTGGSTSGQGGGLLAREREKEELTERLTSLRADMGFIRDEQAKIDAELARWTQQIADLDGRLRSLETEVTRAEGEIRRLSGDVARWTEVLETFAFEAGQIRADLAEGEEGRVKLETELATLAAERAKLEAEVTELTQASEERLRLLDERGKKLTELQVSGADQGANLRALRSQISRLVDDRRALAAEEAERIAQAGGVAERLARVAHEKLAAQAELTESAAAKERLAGERERLQRRRIESQEAVNELERELRQLRRAQTDLTNRRQAVEVETARLQMELESLATRLHETYGLVPTDLAGKALPEGELAFARTRLAELRELIRALGPVNLAAIEEFQTATERLVFLRQQQADLTEAKESLYRAIEELDRKITTVFKQSFEQIRTAFQQVYHDLIEGGRADLQLMDESNLLETGIEIIAQPPGKKPQALSLLSGGERAMTATALLFALLRVKPTPFVVLDEVEAALDEANVDRVGRFLKRFASDGSQFICITHQRGTMAAADTLYGVTMEGTGVSKVVSVRLVDVAKEAG